ncbi:MAG: hypothetical protein CL609_06925 [Anaerolineaceae bacterium]|nr:hypothetical protein [Anaerolineaceae bacterium]
MNYSKAQSSWKFSDKFGNIQIKSGAIYAIIIISALIAFEIFNYSTTDFALRDLLGELKFAGIRWATILSIAFCGIDFAGIARLFTPEQGSDEPKETWFLFGAWLLAATMNAALTWWGISMAIATHTIQSASVIDPEILYTVVPVFVAIMVWVIRILIIGSLSMAGDKIFNNIAKQSVKPVAQKAQQPIQNRGFRTTPATFSTRQATSSTRMNATVEPRPSSNRVEPTYHSYSSRSKINPPTRKL